LQHAVGDVRMPDDPVGLWGSGPLIVRAVELRDVL